MCAPVYLAFPHLELLLPPMVIHHHLFLLFISDQRLSRWCPLPFLKGTTNEFQLFLKQKQQTHSLSYATNILAQLRLKWLSPSGF